MLISITLYTACITSLLAFVLFGVDKRRARLGRRRIRERTLLLASWAMGFLGGWAAMAAFRHKTRKRSFQVGMVLVTLFNLAWLPLWWQFTRG